MGTMQFFWRALAKAAPTGLACGTLYFIIIGALTFFTSTFVNQKVTLLWLVLFVGSGAGLGLLLGVACAVVMSLVLPQVRSLGKPESLRARSNARIVGGITCGATVFLLTLVEQLTNWIDVLAPEFTTVVVVPTAVAAIAGASAAPNLLRLNGKQSEERRD